MNTQDVLNAISDGKTLLQGTGIASHLTYFWLESDGRVGYESAYDDGSGAEPSYMSYEAFAAFVPQRDDWQIAATA